MGRPTRLTPEAQARFVQAIGAGAFPEVAARYAGFSPASLYRYLKGSTPEHAAFREAATKALVELEIRLSGTLVQAALGDPRWALTTLERRFPERWAVRRGAEPDVPAEGDAAWHQRDELVSLDPALVEVLVPRLLQAGERLRNGTPNGRADLSRFESRRPGRPDRPESSSR